MLLAYETGIGNVLHGDQRQIKTSCASIWREGI